MEQKINEFIYWTPRILSIVFILFLAMFSLDVFDAELGFWETILGLFMHNIPVFILLAVLIISWKHEIVGGIAFILAGILLSRSIIISVPALLIGILFIANWFKKRRGNGS